MSNINKLALNKNPTITVLTIIFMMWGFITVVNGVLVDDLIGALEKTDAITMPQKNLLKYIFFLVYFVVAMPAARLVEKVGFKKGVIYGLMLAASCSIFMVAAARELNYYIALSGIIVLASGVTLLQVAANPYAMFLNGGNPASNLTRTQAFNSIGTWLAPLIGVIVASQDAHLEVSAVDNQVNEVLEIAETIILPYILFSVILAGLTIRLNFSDLPDLKVSDDLGMQNDKGDSIFKYKHLILGAIGIFCYVAAEVAIGSNLTNYIRYGLGLEQFYGMEEYLVAYYWGSAMIGRFIGGQILRDKPEHKGIIVAACGALLLLTLSLINTGILGLAFLLFIGLFNSVLFPCIFAISVKGMGRLTAKASGILNMAIIGGAIGMLLMNEMTKALGITNDEDLATTLGGISVMKYALMLAVPFYIYIIYFGFASAKKNKDFIEE